MINDIFCIVNKHVCKISALEIQPSLLCKCRTYNNNDNPSVYFIQIRNCIVENTSLVRSFLTLRIGNARILALLTNTRDVHYGYNIYNENKTRTLNAHMIKRLKFVEKKSKKNNRHCY